MYWKLFGAVLGALMVMALGAGCTVVPPYPNMYGARYDVPTAIPPPPPQARPEPPRETKQVGKRKIEFHSASVPPTDGGGKEIRLGARPVNPQTIADLDQRLAEQTNLRVWHSPRRLYCKVQQAGGKWVTGWLPAGTQLLSRRIGEKDGVTLWHVIEVARCGNPVEGVRIREICPRIEITIREREVVVEPQPVYVESAPPVFYGGTVSWGCGPTYRAQRHHRSNININRTVNVNRTINRSVAPALRPCPPRPPARGYCPPRR